MFRHVAPSKAQHPRSNIIVFRNEGFYTPRYGKNARNARVSTNQKRRAKPPCLASCRACSDGCKTHRYGGIKSIATRQQTTSPQTISVVILGCTCLGMSRLPRPNILVPTSSFSVIRGFTPLASGSIPIHHRFRRRAPVEYHVHTCVRMGMAPQM